MTKRKLKDWVLPVLGIIVLIGTVLCFYLFNRIKTFGKVDDNVYVTDALMDESISVNKEVESPKKTIIKPYDAEGVEIDKYYYKKDDDEGRQQSSLIKYQNIYMPNTGVLYSSANEFEVKVVLDGKVTSVKEDNILGNVIEIEHSNSLITVYQSVKDVKVKVGDVVKQGDVIALSGPNKLEGDMDNYLHFEVYKDATLIDPLEFFEMDINN